MYLNLSFNSELSSNTISEKTFQNAFRHSGTATYSTQASPQWQLDRDKTVSEWKHHWVLQLSYHTLVTQTKEVVLNNRDTLALEKHKLNTFYFCTCVNWTAIQWSLLFKTPPFNNSFKFKTIHQRHTILILLISMSLNYKITLDLRPYLSGWMGGLKMEGPLY